MSGMRTKPWTRAPFLLWRAPTVVLALVVAAAILGIAGSSSSLFLGTAGAAELDRLVDRACQDSSLPVVTNAVDGQIGSAEPPTDGATQTFQANGGPTLYEEQGEIARRAMRDAGLPAPDQILIGEVSVDVNRFEGNPVTVMRPRPDFLDHVTVLDRAPHPVDDGVWVSDKMAEAYQLTAGQPIGLGYANLHVAGVYLRIDAVEVTPEYWCAWNPIIRPNIATNFFPPFALVDSDDTFRKIITAPVGSGQYDVPAVGEWFSPIDVGNLTIDRVRDVVDRQNQVREEIDGALNLHVGSLLQQHLDRATAARSGLSGPVVTVSIAGTVVALMLLAGAGAYWAERRAAEVRLLVSRGIGPIALGIKAVLEMIIPTVAGLACGWIAGLRLVAWLGPTDRFEPDAPVQALATVAIVGLVGVLVLGAVAAIRGRGDADRKVRRHARVWWRVVPWELILVAAAVLTYLRARDHGVSIVDFLVHIPGPLIAFPLLGLAGCLLLVSRILGWTMPLLRRSTSNLPMAGYLAGRRLTAKPVITLALLVATAIPVGVFGFAAALSKSTDASIDAKVMANVGADHAIVTTAKQDEPIPTGGHGTVVTVATNAQFEGFTGATLLGIDTETFARFAAGSLTERPLPDLLDDLAPAEPGQPLSAILVNPRGLGELTSIRVGRGLTLPINVVDRELVFPGLRNGRAPMVVIRKDQTPMLNSTAQHHEEIWTTDAQIGALDKVILENDVPVFTEREPSGALSGTQLVTVTWTLNFLRALAVLTGLIAAAGLLLYLAARSRRRVASYVMSRRIGVRMRTHLASLGLEIATMLFVGGILGVLGARAAVALISPMFDVHPGYPPGFLFSYPVTALVGLAAALLLVTVVTSLTAQRSASRARPATVMRMGGT